MNINWCYVYTFPFRTFNVEQIITHPLWEKDDSLEFNYDYAILKLNNEISFTEQVNAVCLPSNSEEKYHNENLLISGWGNTVMSGNELSNWLQVKKNFFTKPYIWFG